MNNLQKTAKRKKIIKGAFVYLLMAFFLVITIYPIIWMVSGSLKSESEFYRCPVPIAS